MIPSYEVGAVFRVSDQATPTMQLMTREANTLAASIDRLRANITALGRSPGLTRLATQMRGINATMAAMPAGAARFGRAIDMSATRATAGMARVERAANAATAALARTAGAAATIGPAAAAALPGRGGGGGIAPP